MFLFAHMSSLLVVLHSCPLRGLQSHLVKDGAGQGSFFILSKQLV